MQRSRRLYQQRLTAMLNTRKRLRRLLQQRRSQLHQDDASDRGRGRGRNFLGPRLPPGTAVMPVAGRQDDRDKAQA
jgi:hypothetical protein